MDYSKEMLMQEIFKKMESLDDALKSCMEFVNAINEERKVIRYLLWLIYEKKDS